MNPSGNGSGGWEAAKVGAEASPEQPGVQPCNLEPMISVSWRDHDFEKFRKGTTPPTKDLVITSTGTATLSNITVNVGGGQFKVGGGAASLPPGMSATVQVTFEPTEYGEKTAAITVTSNAKNENPITLNVKGKQYSVITFVLEEEKPPSAKVAGVKLKIKQAGGEQKEVTTDEHGKVEFETEKDDNFEVEAGEWQDVLEFRSITTA